jgi:hypothetical protein
MVDRSPQITDDSWGSLEIEGHGRFKDAKLWPGGARSWDWRETGTNHAPGIQFKDAEELLAHGTQSVVLSRGRQGALQVPQETVDALRERGMEVHVLDTPDAIRTYNELAERMPVAALIHSTC